MALRTACTFTANYTDGTSSQFTQNFSDWGRLSNFAGEPIAASMPYRDGSNGGMGAGPFTCTATLSAECEQDAPEH